MFWKGLFRDQNFFPSRTDEGEERKTQFYLRGTKRDEKKEGGKKQFNFVFHKQVQFFFAKLRRGQENRIKNEKSSHEKGRQRMGVDYFARFFAFALMMGKRHKDGHLEKTNFPAHLIPFPFSSQG